MSTPRATVACPTCELREHFSELADAHPRTEEHHAETSHDPAWKLGRFAPGMKKVGDETGICNVNLNENN